MKTMNEDVVSGIIQGTLDTFKDTMVPDRIGRLTAHTVMLKRDEIVLSLQKQLGSARIDDDYLRGAIALHAKNDLETDTQEMVRGIITGALLAYRKQPKAPFYMDGMGA